MSGFARDESPVYSPNSPYYSDEGEVIEESPRNRRAAGSRVCDKPITPDLATALNNYKKSASATARGKKGKPVEAVAEAVAEAPAAAARARARAPEPGPGPGPGPGPMTFQELYTAVQEDQAKPKTEQIYPASLLVLLKQTIRFRTDLYDRDQRVIEGQVIRTGNEGDGPAARPLIPLLTKEQSERYTPEVRRKLIADFIKTINSVEAIQVSDRINKYVALKIPIVYFAMDGSLVITNLCWPRQELLDIFYINFKEEKLKNPTIGIIQYMDTFFDNIYEIFPGLSTIQQMVIAAQQTNIVNFMPSDVAEQDMNSRIENTRRLANRLRNFLGGISVNLDAQPGDPVKPFSMLEKLLCINTSNTVASSRLVEIAETIRFYSTPDRNVGGLLIQVPETSQHQMAEWEKQTNFVLNCITIISLIVVLFPSRICHKTAKDVIDYAKYVLGTTLFISFEQQIFDCIGTVLDLPRLIEIGQSVGTGAYAIGTSIATGARTVGSTVSSGAKVFREVATATKENLEEIIRMLLSKTPEQITGPQDDVYYENLDRLLAQDEEDRQYILNVAKELGVCHQPDLAWRGSVSRSASPGSALENTMEEDTRTEFENLGTVFGRSPSLSQTSDSTTGKRKRGGKKTKTQKRKITKRRKSKQAKQTRKHKKTLRKR